MEINNPKISVIIPVYNGERTLEQCLSSVINQTYKNYELIVVDNGSTDKTRQIIQHFQQADKKVIYVFEPKIGRGAARNTGVSNALGEIIAMTDSDCVVPQNWLEEITKPIIKNEETAAMGFEENPTENFWAKNIQIANWEFVKRNLDNGYSNGLDTKNFAIKSEMVKTLSFDEDLKTLEDFDMVLKLRKKTSIKIKFLPNVKVKHLHRGSIWTVIKMQFERGESACRIYKKYKTFPNIKKEVMFKSFSLRNNILLPAWIIIQFIKKSFKEASFISINDISFRLGALYGYLFI